MPRVNPEILVWARETAGLTQDKAARKLGFQDSAQSLAMDKLAAIESGQKEPSRPQILKMADKYRRPLLTFYLSQPPKKSGRGIDFRTLPNDYESEGENLLEALTRDITARQSMVRALLEDEDEAHVIPFVGSQRMEDGPEIVLNSLMTWLDIDAHLYRAQPTVSSAFDLLRSKAERSGIFVLLKGDLGNYASAIETAVFRGFSIADNVAPFIVINDQDARTAWSFTLLHETVHLLLGHTGVSSEYGDNEVERFCNDVAGNFLLEDSLLRNSFDECIGSMEEISVQIGVFAEKFKVSRSMVAYKAYRSQLIDRDVYRELFLRFRGAWQEERDATRTKRRDDKNHPDYYRIRRHRLGRRITGLIERMISAGAVSTSRAARILGVSPRQVRPLLEAGHPS